MALDVKRIQAKLQFIQDNLDLLRELSTYSETEFVADRVKFYAAVHGLQVSIEAMLDVFTHIIARLRLGAPTSDRETLEIALRKNLTTLDHFQRYVQMNRFRNRVVHGYMDVDAGQVYRMLHKDLGDFELFFDDVRKVVAKELAKEKNSKKKTNSRN